MKQITYRGKTFTYDDVLRAMERFDAELRKSLPDKHWGIYAIRHNSSDYPPKTIMRLITGLTKVGSGGKQLNSRYENLGFEIVIRDENGPTIVDGSPVEETETETSLSLESDMENALVTNLEQLEKGLRLYEDGSLTGQQFDTKEAGRIDLLAVDAHDDLVVIELKAEDADRQVCGQIQAYMGWVKKHLASGKKVRGIIVANDFTKRALYAAEVVPDLTLKKYQISFRFTDAE